MDDEEAGEWIKLAQETIEEKQRAEEIKNLEEEVKRVNSVVEEVHIDLQKSDGNDELPKGFEG